MSIHLLDHRMLASMCMQFALRVGILTHCSQCLLCVGVFTCELDIIAFRFIWRPSASDLSPPCPRLLTAPTRVLTFSTRSISLLPCTSSILDGIGSVYQLRVGCCSYTRSPAGVWCFFNGGVFFCCAAPRLPASACERGGNGALL